MANALSTAGMLVKYCVETTAGTRPTLNYTTIPGCKAIPAIFNEPNTLQSTTLSATKNHTYVLALTTLAVLFPLPSTIIRRLELRGITAFLRLPVSLVASRCGSRCTTPTPTWTASISPVSLCPLALAALMWIVSLRTTPTFFRRVTMCSPLLLPFLPDSQKYGARSLSRPQTT